MTQPNSADRDAPAIPEKLVVTKLLWTGTAWLQPGTPFNQQQVDEAQLRHYLTHGFVADAEQIEAARNPEATEAKVEASAAERKALQLQTQLSNATGEVQQLNSKLQTLEGQLGERDTSLRALQASLDAVTKQRDGNAEKVKTLEGQLAEYQALGPLLPEGLTPNARKSLIEAGFVGKQALARATDEELRALDDVGPGTVTKLREFSQ